MMKEGKFGVSEAVCLTTITISCKIFFTSPGFLARFVGTASWFMNLISCAISILNFTFICLLLKRFPKKNIVEIFNLSLGKIWGSIFSFILAAFFLQDAATILREFTDVMKVFVFPETPLSIIIGAMMIVVTIGAYLGLESIARVAKLLAYPSLIGFLLLLIFGIETYELKNLFPIFGYGLDKIMLHGMMRTSIYNEVVMLALFSASLQGIHHIKKAGYISLIISGLLISLGLLSITLAFPYQTTQELIAPIYLLARIIKIGPFFQRLDPVFLFIWNITTIITICMLFYASLSTYCKMFRLEDKRPVILPMAIILFTITIMPKDFPGVARVMINQTMKFAWVILYILPLTTLIVAVVRKKRGEKING